MGERLKIKMVTVAPDFWVERWTDDCGYPAARTHDTIVVQVMDGREFILPVMRPYTAAEVDAFNAMLEADPETYYDQSPITGGMTNLYWGYQVPALIEWIGAEGEIDTEFYTLFEEDPSTFEEKMEAAFIEEFGDRRMYA